MTEEESVVFKLRGDHKIFTISLHEDCEFNYDPTSRERCYNLTVRQAEHLFFELMRLVPEFRRDER